MSPLDVSSATPLDSAGAFDRLLRDLDEDRREVIVAIARKASGRQTVTFHELLEIAMCHGWVDTQTAPYRRRPVRDPLCPPAARVRTGRIAIASSHADCALKAG